MIPRVLVPMYAAAVLASCRSSPDKGQSLAVVDGSRHADARPAPLVQSSVDGKAAMVDKDATSLLAQAAEERSSGARRPALLNPGAKEQKATDVAMAFLRKEGVDVDRFTHARATKSGTSWEVVLVEVVKKPRFGGFEYWVTLAEPGLRVVKWSKMQ